jgi:hypothetical protein
MANPQPTVNFVAQQNQLFFFDPTQVNVVQSVAALNGFQGLGGQKSSIKLSNFDSAGYEEYAPGLVDPGKPTGTVILNYGDASHQLLQKLLGLGNTGVTSWFFAQSDGAGTAAVPTAPGNVMTLPLGTLVAAPGTLTPSTSTTGGSLAAATYFYKMTAINLAGETTGSAEASQVTTGATSTVTFTFSTVAGATGYKVYRSTTTGAEAFLTQIGLVTTFTDFGNITPTAGQTVPTANTTNGYSRSGWTLTGFVAEFGFQTQVNNVAMCKLTIQATGSRGMVVRGNSAVI